MGQKWWSAFLLVVGGSILLLTACGGTAGATPEPVAADEDIDAARAALIAYFDLLSAGRYEEAAAYYGGSYDVLIEYNPETDPQDRAALFEAACTVNGFLCLPVGEVVYASEVSSGEFRFTVTFLNADGSPFGAFSGADPGQFDFSVQAVGEQFLVQELPLYLP